MENTLSTIKKKEKNIDYPFKLDNSVVITSNINLGIDEKIVNTSKGNNSAGTLTNNLNLEQEISLNFSESNIIGSMEENSKDSAINSLGDNLGLNLRK